MRGEVQMLHEQDPIRATLKPVLEQVVENLREVKSTDFVVQFESRGTVLYHIAVHTGAAQVGEGAHPKATLTVAADEDAFVRIVNCKFDFRDPVQLSRMTLTGDRDALRILVPHLYAHRNRDMRRRLQIAEEAARKHGPFETIERVHRPSAADLRQAAATSKPLLITGLVETWAASKWTFESLKQQYGHIQYSPEATVAERIDWSLAGEVSRGTGGMMLPRELLGDVDFSHFFSDDMYTRPTFWVGAAGSITALHRDLIHAMSAQIVGRKRWTLYSPDQAELVYPVTLNMLVDGSEACGVDVEKPNLAEHPLFAKARPLQVDVEPGQMLFFPCGWFHHVRALDPVVSVTIGFFDEGQRPAHTAADAKA
jgi:hypothetical protein